MDYPRLARHTVNAARLADMMQILIRHGFADLLRRSGLRERLPARLFRRIDLRPAEEGSVETFGERLRAALTELGPTFIKCGQVLSTRPDLVGPETADELSRLQDQVPPRRFREMAEVIESELGAPVAHLFAEFDVKPVASASISQVYRARLHTGEAVAVKVQRPGIRDIIESDLRIMRQVAQWLEGRWDELKWVDPPGIVAEFEHSIRRELDFNIEASIVERFRERLADHAGVFIPAVHREYCSSRVLTMDWVDGVRVDRFEDYDARGCERETIARLCCQVLCELIFEHRIFHADPHPGNIFILRDNRIGILDLGMAGHLEEGDADALADLILAVLHEDAAECAQAVLNLTTDGLAEDRKALEHELADFIAFEARTVIGAGQVAKGLERAVQIVRHHGLELSPRFAMLIKALATIETLGRTLVPEIDFTELIQPYLEKLITHRYEPGKMLKGVKRNLRLLVQLGEQAPTDLLHLLRQLRRGRFQTRLHADQLDYLIAVIDRGSQRQAVSLLTAALIIGSSLLIHSGGAASRLGAAGFVLAGIFGAATIVSILWSKKL